MFINEIFYSIQGEGRYMGTPVIFLRTQGCSLHCPWCDSANTWITGTNEYDIKKLLPDLQRAAHGKTNRIVITGGEPTEQKDLYVIARELKMEGYSLHLETNGTNYVSPGYFDHVVCSPKPGNDYKIPGGQIDELKFVIGADDDVNKIINGAVRDKWAGRIWLQPKANGQEILSTSVKACVQAAMLDPRLRVGVQLHKIIGVQ